MKFTKHNVHNLFKQESYQVPTFYFNNFIRHLKAKHCKYIQQLVLFKPCGLVKKSNSLFPT